MTLRFDDWLPQQRWYAGRSRQLIDVVPARTIALGIDADLDLDLVLLDANFADGTTERYQVVVHWHPGSVDGRDTVAIIGGDGERTAYDALYDPVATRYLLSLFDRSAQIGGVRFEKEPGVALPLEAAPRVSSAEQSNTSVVFDKDAIFKLFRRITPGINPDIELSRVLGRAGNTHVARLLGSIETFDGDEPCALGMITEFAAGSTEGWDMATAGGHERFDGESRGLGEAVASVHASLAAELGTSTVEFPADTLLERLATAAAAVPELGEFVPQIEQRYRKLAEDSVTVQRIHGDLHLGQVLRAPAGWLVIDFEGEPGQPLTERRRQDSPLRDVAGMLRSYDYAAHQRLIGSDGGEESTTEARAWAESNIASFCEGYTAVSGTDPRDHGGVLAAYELDKAVYEAAYEARFRPAWLPIPLRSIARLAS